MKKITATALFIFWAIVVAILSAGLLTYEEGKKATGIQPQTESTATTSSVKNLSMQEIAAHNSAASCWLLINGKVYDVTSFLNQHPGDASTIIPTCGTDATQAYATMGRETNPRAHSQNANEMLKAYYIGDFGKAAAIAQKPTATQQSRPTPATGTAIPTTAPKVTLSAQEIAKHNTTANCWMIVNGNVYNVTSYIPRHPGGAGAIQPYCGKDGTSAFEGLPHSMNAQQLLANYLVGAVGAQTTVQPSQQTTNQPTTPISAKGDDGERDD